MLRTVSRSVTAMLVAVVVLAGPGLAQSRVTPPREFLGFSFGDDYQLANYEKLTAYWQKLAAESDRLLLREIGKTAEGRTMYLVIVSAPANLRSLARYQDVSRRLALAEGLTDEQARALAKEGRAVVWIDGGLHATEVLGAQQLGEMIYQMVSRTDEETMRILDDVIVLFVHANPDGNTLVADWYNRSPVPEKRSLAPGLPRLYQKYIGHDNNRDFFASNQPETEAMNRVMYREWFPQIVYNHHQTGPAGAVMFAPPFRDPFNYNFDPLVV
ncbi:MAG: peptidase, partial [Gemmatimonadetes bacterium]|nr:peptidase [Gemmatimonadota bacterium]